MNKLYLCWRQRRPIYAPGENSDQDMLNIKQFKVPIAYMHALFLLYVCILNVLATPVEIVETNTMKTRLRVSTSLLLFQSDINMTGKQHWQS